jgi:hypothetical protein
MANARRAYLCLADNDPEHLSLTDAQKAISEDWVKAYKDLRLHSNAEAEPHHGGALP